MNEDTVVLLALNDDRVAASTLLARIAAELDMLADALGRHTGHGPGLGAGAGLAQHLHDLGLTCDRFRERARQLDGIADQMRRMEARAK